MASKAEELARRVVSTHVETFKRLVNKRGVAGLDRLYREASLELRARIATQRRPDGATAVQLRALLAQVDGVLEAFGKNLERQTKTAAKEAVALGMAHGVDEWQRISKEFSGLTPVVEIDVPARLRNLTDPEATLLRRISTRIGTWSTEAVTKMEERLSLGVMSGATTEQMIDDLVGEFGLKGERYRAERIVRTELNNAHNAGRIDSTREIEKELGRPMFKRLISTFDDRTGDDSLLLHGQVVPVDQPFEWKRKVRGNWVVEKYMHPPNRPNDREVMIPWDPEWESESNEQPLTKSELVGEGVDVPPGHEPGEPYSSEGRAAKQKALAVKPETPPEDETPEDESPTLPEIQTEEFGELGELEELVEPVEPVETPRDRSMRTRFPIGKFDSYKRDPTYSPSFDFDSTSEVFLQAKVPERGKKFSNGADFRKAFNGLMSEHEMVVQDIVGGVGNKDQLMILPKKEEITLRGSHWSDGKMDISHTVHGEAVELFKLISEADRRWPEGGAEKQKFLSKVEARHLAAVRTYVHETIHSCAPKIGLGTSIRTRVGKILEEVTTELLARKITLDKFETKLPGVNVSDHLEKLGSYKRWIGTFSSHVESFLKSRGVKVSSDQVREMITTASKKMRRYATTIDETGVLTKEDSAKYLESDQKFMHFFTRHLELPNVTGDDALELQRELADHLFTSEYPKTP